jgi:hypothetical protein
MKYIKEYNEYESGIGVEDIQDCFRDLIDMGIYVKIVIPAAHTLGFAGLSTFDKVFAVSINLDQRTQPFGQNDMSDQKLSEYGVRYRAVIGGQEITELMAESIAKCEGVLELDLFRAELKWVNAGEWRNARKKNMKAKGISDEDIEALAIGDGPGMLDRTFTKECRIRRTDTPMIASISAKLNMQDLEEEIIRKGDRLRNIAIYFVVKR